MKRIISILLCCLFTFGLIGCDNKADNTSKDQYADKDFITSLSKALDKRWDLNDKKQEEEKSTGQKTKTGSDAHKKWYVSFVDAELSELENYKDAKFKDSKLQEKAIQYINLINDQKSATDYIQVDYNKYLQLWSQAYNKRTQLIIDFVNNYGLTVSEKHSQALKDIMLNGQEVTKAEDNKNAVKVMTDAIKFEKADNSSDWKKYQAVVENTTDLDFSYFDLSINLLDKDGVIVNTEHANVANWGKGQKVKFEFSSNKEFVSTSIVADYNTK